MTISNNTNFENNEVSHENEVIKDPQDRRRHLSKHDKQVMWRRNQVLTLLTKGCSIYECATVLKISSSTAARDAVFLKNDANRALKERIQNLGHEYSMTYRGLSECLKHAWGTLLEDSQSKNKVSVIALIADIYEKRMNLCTNADIINEALQHVATIQEVIQKLEAKEQLTNAGEKP